MAEPQKPKRSESGHLDERSRDSVTVFEKESRKKPLLYRPDGKPLYDAPRKVGFRP